MTRKFLCLLLFSSLLPLSSLMQGCATPSCTTYVDQLTTCADKVLTVYGEKQEGTCKLGAANQCTTGQLCVQAPGEAFAACFTPGEAYKSFKEMIATSQRFCDDVFAGRQNKYMRCVADAGCDAKKINDCSTKLVSLTKQAKKAGESGGFLVSFLAFIVFSMVAGGLILFFLIKILDGQNPKNTILRGLLVGAAVGVVTFPLVYISPLLGVLLSSSALFGVVMLVYQQGAFLSTVVTATHIIWVQVFFTMFVSSEMMHGEAWIAQAEHFRRSVSAHHERVAKSVEEIERDRKRAAEARKRAAEEEKKRKEEEAKKKAEEEAKKKAEEEAKKAESNKPKRKRRRRRR
ncbi:MAG: hypothetical protein H6728_08265 [Myxococcales bacterium]|nr:hypothetical protein [Myxococcales bacterium]